MHAGKALLLVVLGGLVLAADTTEAEPVQAVAAATQTKAKTAQAAPVQQTYSLDLDTTKYEKKTMTVDGKKVASGPMKTGCMWPILSIRHTSP